MDAAQIGVIHAQVVNIGRPQIRTIEAAGVTDVLTKSLGTNNPITLVKATFDALSKLRTKQDIERLRGVSLS